MSVTTTFTGDPERTHAALAQCDRLKHERAIVGQHLGFALCADPVFDMVLELYCAFVRNYDLSLSGLGAMANVPPTTALRCIRAMEKLGLVERRDDRNDGRRTLVRLSLKAIGMLENMLAAMDAPARNRLAP